MDHILEIETTIESERVDSSVVMQDGVIGVLAYYDVFAYPLTAREIYTFLPIGGVDEKALAAVLPGLVEQKAIDCDRGYYFLPHRNAGVVDRRLAMEKGGDRMWSIARRVGALMRHAPFVRAVFISGQLSRYIADEKSDIDYFIVTEPERLWIVRALFVFVRRTLLLNNRTYFCTNYYVTTDNLEIRERNAYAACEVASLKPLYNREIFDWFIARNDWVREFYPNFSIDRMEIRDGVDGSSRLQRVIEKLVPSRLANRLDLWLMDLTRRFWKKKFPNRPAESYDVSFRTRRDESRAHPDDQAPIVLERYNDVLSKYR